MSRTHVEAIPTNIMLTTANVGSIFEDPIRLMRNWLNEFLEKVSQIQPKFLALHLQEVGGKTYEKSLQHVQDFVDTLCDAKEMHDFTSIRIYLDEDYKSAESFTALGSLYFIHKDLNYVKLWNFKSQCWESVHNVYIYSGNINEVDTKEKRKFPLNFFPDKKWSRKGYLRTRWCIGETVLDLVNIHLFHDASNLEACDRFPSIYSTVRRRALLYTLNRLYEDSTNGLVPHLIFGDFNFRCDLEGFLQELSKDLIVFRTHNFDDNYSKLFLTNTAGKNILQIGKKEFHHAEHQIMFKKYWFRKFDKELDGIKNLLYEFPVEFDPSYPYEENPELPNSFMPTRCPAWCDRILLSPLLFDMICKESVSYNIIGREVCMGDHKPIYLNFRLKTTPGAKCASSEVYVCYERIVNEFKQRWRKEDYTHNFDIVQKTRYVFVKNTSNTEEAVVLNRVPHNEDILKYIIDNYEVPSIYKETAI